MLWWLSRKLPDELDTKAISERAGYMHKHLGVWKSLLCTGVCYFWKVSVRSLAEDDTQSIRPKPETPFMSCQEVWTLSCRRMETCKEANCLSGEWRGHNWKILNKKSLESCLLICLLFNHSVCSEEGGLRDRNKEVIAKNMMLDDLKLKLQSQGVERWVQCLAEGKKCMEVMMKVWAIWRWWR